MKRFVTLAALTAVALMVALAAVASWDVRREAVLRPQGYVTEGGAFGVTVGMPLKAAEAKLLSLSGVQDDGRNASGRCIMRHFDNDVVVHRYFDSSWRHGVICLAERDGRVLEVIWEYAFPFPTLP